MAGFLDTLKTGFAEFQDTFGAGGLNNGAALIRAASAGKAQQRPFEVGFTSYSISQSIEHRVYIKVPTYYTQSRELTGALAGKDTSSYGAGWQGIYFPVTPTIRQDSKANWVAANPQQSNYAVYSYNHSEVGTISVSGKFPVQTANEAYYWLSTVNALRALTKMRTGKDQVPGAPPPVCRFYAYGSSVYENVPVAIGDFSIELPENVDYISSADLTSSFKAPALSTITVNLIPVYSRRQMAAFSVGGMLNGSLNGQGYL